MNCVKAKDLLGMYLDGELKGRHKQGVSEHLDACESCRGELTSISSLSARLAGLPKCEPDEAFYRRLFQRLWEERQPAPTMSGRYVWQAAFAAAAMLFLFFALRLPLAPVEQATNPAITPPQATALPPQPTQQPTAVRVPQTKQAKSTEPRARAVRAQKQVPPAPRFRKPRPAPRVMLAAHSGADNPETRVSAAPPEPTPEQVAAVSDALARLTTAAQETGSALHRAVALQAKRQISARETLETAFSAFAVSPATTREGPESHEL